MSAASKIEHMLAKSRASQHVVSPVSSHFCSTYFTEHTYGTYNELQMYNSLKMTLLYFNALSGRLKYFYWFRKTISPQKSRKSQNKVRV